MTHGWRSAALLTAGLALAAGGTVVPAQADDAGSVPWYLAQTVTWKPCKDDKTLDCATIEVPLDWSQPDGARITLALNRYAASTQPAPLGSLVVNPGGPGASGMDLAAGAGMMFDNLLIQNYDIVGFDPRGVGQSSAVTCATKGSQLDSWTSSYYAVTAKGRAKAIKAYKAIAARCAKLTGPLLGHIDTESSARDMDAIRAALGETKLNYFGFSYGTKLGAYYAELFGDNVGRFVLDGAMDPSKDGDATSLSQLRGFDLAFNNFAAWCAKDKDCEAGNTAKAVRATAKAVVKRSLSKPLKVGKRTLTPTLVETGLIYPLYSQTSWPWLGIALTSAAAGDGEMLLWLADQYNGREDGGVYADNSTEAFTAYNCLDYGRGNSTLKQAKAQVSKATKISSVLGPLWEGNGIDICTYWKYPQTGRPHKVHSTTTSPIVVVGTTGDPATPYSQAVALSKQLATARLLTYKGDGHTAYGENHCINKAVDDYLVKGTVPAKGKTC
jgi:pimeloyl-ACP methyl ester carboxylesterase